jgi:hypothetical protein
MELPFSYLPRFSIDRLLGSLGEMLCKRGKFFFKKNKSSLNFIVTRNFNWSLEFFGNKLVMLKRRWKLP